LKEPSTMSRARMPLVVIAGRIEYLINNQNRDRKSR
jgi:hypothetical protein